MLLLTKSEIKMAAYWPSSFLRLYSSLSLKTQKRTRPIFSHLDRTSLVNQGFIIWPKRELLLAGLTREIPSGLDGSISPFRVANQNAGFALSSPLVDSAMQARKTTVRIQISRASIMQNGFFFPSRFDCDWRAPL